MQGKTREHWMELCEQAAAEQDSERLMKLIREIDEMLEQKELRLKGRRGESSQSEQNGRG